MISNLEEIRNPITEQLHNTHPIVFHDYPCQDVVNSLQSKQTAVKAIEIPEVFLLLSYLLSRRDQFL
jgi:hypothetical protein